MVRLLPITDLRPELIGYHGQGLHFGGVQVNHRRIVEIIEQNTVTGDFIPMFEKAKKAWVKIDQHTFEFLVGFDCKWLVNSKAEQTAAVEMICAVIPQDAAFTFGYQKHGKIVVSLQAIEKAAIFKPGDLQGHLPGLRIIQCK